MALLWRLRRQIAAALLLLVAAAAAVPTRAANDDGDDDSDVATIAVKSRSINRDFPLWSGTPLRHKLRAACTFDAAALDGFGKLTSLRDAGHLPAGVLYDVAFVGANGAQLTLGDRSAPRTLCAPIAADSSDAGTSGGTTHHKHEQRHAGRGVRLTSTENDDPNQGAYTALGDGGSLVLRFTRPIRAVVLHLDDVDATDNALVFTPGRRGRAGRPVRVAAVGGRAQAAVMVMDGGGFDQLAVSQTSASAAGLCLRVVAWPCEQMYTEFRRRRKRDALQDDDDGDDDDDTPSLVVEVAADGDDREGDSHAGIELAAFARTTQPAARFDVRSLRAGDDVRDHLPALGLIRSMQFHGTFAPVDSNTPYSVGFSTPVAAQSALCPVEGVDQQAVVSSAAASASLTHFSRATLDSDGDVVFVIELMKKVRSITVVFTAMQDNVSANDGTRFTIVPGSNGEEGNAVVTREAQFNEDAYTVVAVDGQGFDQLAFVRDRLTAGTTFCLAYVAFSAEQVREYYNNAGDEFEEDDDEGLAPGAVDGDYGDYSIDSDDGDDGNEQSNTGQAQREARAARRKARTPLR